VFAILEAINTRPQPFAFYTAEELWTDAHTAGQMLAFHLNEDIDVASRQAHFIDRSVAWITGRFNLADGVRIADFGCGPGLYATRLARKGARVTGIDFSENSIQYARAVADREALPIAYVHQNYLAFDTDDRFDLILMIMCDYGALGPDQRRQLRHIFHHLLAEGGSVLLDVYALKAFGQREEAATYAANLLDGFWSADRYYGFRNTFKYEQEKVVLDQYTIVESARTRTIYNWLQYFSPEALASEFAESGFKVEGFYGDVAGSAFDPQGQEFAIVARRY
jgi:cyclopropane fatty-acyl-phospholipid synthase-like methyltransferase